MHVFLYKMNNILNNTYLKDMLKHNCTEKILKLTQPKISIELYISQKDYNSLQRANNIIIALKQCELFILFSLEFY